VRDWINYEEPGLEGWGAEGRGKVGETYCFLISRICDPCCLSLNNGSLIIAGAGVARGCKSVPTCEEAYDKVGTYVKRRGRGVMRKEGEAGLRLTSSGMSWSKYRVSSSDANSGR
jgi:hypothetical protein